jgi:cytochrome c556
LLLFKSEILGYGPDAAPEARHQFGGIENMKIKILVAAALFAAGTTAAWAAADDTIKTRQTCMKAQGGLMGVIVPMFKGEKAYDKAAVDAAVAASNTACATWANFWGPETAKGETVETWVKPEVWTDTAGFEKVSNAGYTAMQALTASTDEASFKAAFPAVGAGCKGCHEGFRRPKQ